MLHKLPRSIINLGCNWSDYSNVRHLCVCLKNQKSSFGLICDFNIYLIFQVTPLFVPCRIGNYQSAVDVARLLLQYGANPNKLAKDEQGNCCAPLYWACYHGRVEMVEALLRSGARQDHGTETTPFKTVTRDPKIDKLLREFASGEATHFRTSADEIERSLQKKKPHIYTKLRSIFDGKSVRQVLEEGRIVIQTALLALLSIFLPEWRDDLQTMTTTPLSGAVNPNCRGV